MIQMLDARAQLLQARCFIPMLAAILAAGDDHARRPVREPDGALRLVDVLAAGAARAKSVNLALPQQLIIGFRQYDLFSHSYE